MNIETYEMPKIIGWKPRICINDQYDWHIAPVAVYDRRFSVESPMTNALRYWLHAEPKL